MPLTKSRERFKNFEAIICNYSFTELSLLLTSRVNMHLDEMPTGISHSFAVLSALTVKTLSPLVVKVELQIFSVWGLKSSLPWWGDSR
jgi:hypothetical protein